MVFIYEGRSLPTEYNYVLAILCGIYTECESLTESFATIIKERLFSFLESGEINRAPIIEGPRDPFMDFWRVYGGVIDDDIILVDDVEYCLEWLSKSDGPATSDEEQQG